MIARVWAVVPQKMPIVMHRAECRRPLHVPRGSVAGANRVACAVLRLGRCNLIHERRFATESCGTTELEARARACYCAEDVEQAGRLRGCMVG